MHKFFFVGNPSLIEGLVAWEVLVAILGSDKCSLGFLCRQSLLPPTIIILHHAPSISDKRTCVNQKSGRGAG
jgi:hypothetical protein